jgi:hypothetical protein
VLHDSDCTYKAASRKVPSRKQAELRRQRREQDLQSRVESLECQLTTVLERLQGLEENRGGAAHLAATLEEDLSPHANDCANLPSLPPLQEALPVIEHYLATFNSVLPLFHPPTLLQTVRTWYQAPHSSDAVSWGVINVVLALAHHTSSTDHGCETGNAATYLNNAQSVVAEIMMRDATLPSVQVLLGLAMLFWSIDDLQPALILVGTALRLAHRLEIHSRKASEYCGASLSLQRSRVFWMAYILDRDISLQSRVAPLQLDTDVDLDLPPLDSEDDMAGFIFSVDGQTKMNYFRARVQLAQIQGNVYNSVYSTSAQNQDPEERARGAGRIMTALDNWRREIPPDFQIASIRPCRFSELSRFLCLLYSTCLSCRALTTFASASDSFHYSEWIRTVREYGGKVAAGQEISHAPIPQGWHALVDASREYMEFFNTIQCTDRFFLWYVTTPRLPLASPPPTANQTDARQV